MIISSFFERKKDTARFLLALCLCVVVSACVADKAADSDSVSPPIPLTPQQLIYGLSVGVPEGWVVSGSADVNATTKTEINKAIANGKRIPVLDMYHPANTEDKMDARMSIFLLDAKANFMPEDGAKNMTQEDFDAIAKNIIDSQQQKARETNTESNMIEWKVYRTIIDGNVAIVQEGLGKKPTSGEMRICYVDIYLPDGKGLAVRGLGDAGIAANRSMLTRIASSVKFSATLR